MAERRGVLRRRRVLSRKGEREGEREEGSCTQSGGETPQIA